MLQHGEIISYNSKLFEHSKHLNSNQIGKVAKFTCRGLIFSVFRNKNEVLIFDLHSRNGQGFTDPTGHAELLESGQSSSVNCNFIKSIFKANVSNSANLQYNIQYAKVHISKVSINNLQNVLN